MRLWSLHPSYLDAKGLVALWREGLLAQKVLEGKTRGYRNHPQLIRFSTTASPAASMANYLAGVWAEADSRGYRFDRDKINGIAAGEILSVTEGQVAYEWAHLMRKLADRDPERRRRLSGTRTIKLHPLFQQVEGAIEEWEIL